MTDELIGLRGRVMALAVDFGTRARNTVASVESLLGSGHEFDAAELSAVGKAWADASAALWSLVGSEAKHEEGKGKIFVRVGFSELAERFEREERLTRRVAELEAKLAEWHTPLTLRKLDTQKNQQDIPSLYIAGGSSERLTVGRVWIDRAIEAGAHAGNQAARIAARRRATPII